MGFRDFEMIEGYGGVRDRGGQRDAVGAGSIGGTQRRFVLICVFLIREKSSHTCMLM